MVKIRIDGDTKDFEQKINGLCKQPSKKNVNFSQTLQEALKQKLDIAQ